MMSEEVINKINNDYQSMHEIILKTHRDREILLAVEDCGILPHQIADKSLLFIDAKAPYKQGDFIFIYEERNGEGFPRLTKARSDNEENFIARLMMTVKVF